MASAQLGQTVKGISDGKLHIIDDNLVLSNQVEEYLRAVDLYNRGFNYNLVAVFGSQSTGKSTLLNLLFETNFDVMNNEKRQQTTKGLWLSTGTPPTTLVLDVEGTDGRERGENQDMERKSALFSLAISEVLLINLFEQDVGRYNGANYGLLKTVFEVNLQLFQAKGSPKTLLLFVIRDHTATPLSSLEKTLREDLDKMWRELSKPEGFENSQLLDLFDLSFIGLPHKIYVPKEFNDRVIQFREWFRNPENPNYVFKHAYRRQIPADGFAQFASSVWTEIILNRDLDLPTQRQLLAQYRCNEIMKAALDEFNSQFKPLERKAEAGSLIPELGQLMEQGRQGAKEKYDTQANRYDVTVCNQVRKELMQAIHTSLHVLYSAQLRNLLNEATNFFKTAFEGMLKKNGDNLMDIATKANTEAEEFFRMKATEITLTDTDWTYLDTMEVLHSSIAELIQKRRKEEIKALFDNAKSSLQEILIEPLNEHMLEPTEAMWTQIRVALTEALQKLHNKVSKRLAGMRPSDEEAHQFDENLKREISLLLMKRLQQETSDSVIIPKLRKRFERFFRYDEHSRPRVWQPTDDVNKVFDAALAKTEATLELHKRIELDLSDIGVNLSDEERILIKPGRRAAIWDELLLLAQSQYKEAKNSNSQILSNIPMWAWLLLFIFAWNDFVYFLTDPFNTVVNLCLFAGLVYGCYYAMVFFELQDYIRNLIQKVVQQLVQIFGSLLVNAATQSRTQVRAGSSSSFARPKTD